MLLSPKVNVSSFRIRMLPEYVSFEKWEDAATREHGKMLGNGNEQKNTLELN